MFYCREVRSPWNFAELKGSNSSASGESEDTSALRCLGSSCGAGKSLENTSI